MINDRDLLAAPVPHLVRSITIPASIGYFFNTMYNVVDTWYAGMISTDALAALGLSFPVFFIIIAVASGLSTGVSALIANAIGSGRQGDAGRVAMQSVTFTLLVSVAVGLFGGAISASAFRWLGAAPEPARLGASYMTIIFSGSLFFNLSHVLNAFLVARGDTRTYRNVLIAGVALNVALDPWFIYGGFGIPAMGFSGIAISTVMIQAAGCAYLYRQVRKRGALDRPTLTTLGFDRGTAAEITRQSGPAMMNMMTVGIGIMVLTYFVNRFGTEAVAAYGIATRIEQIILLPAIGLNMAVLSIVGQNNGAGRFDRVHEAVRAALRFGVYVLIPAIPLMLVWPDAAMSVFSRDRDVIRIGAEYLRIASFLIYAYVLLFTLTAVLQAVKQPMYAIWIGIYRQIVAPLIIIMLLVRMTDIGVWSVWVSVAFTTWSAALFTVWYTFRALRKITDRRNSHADASSRP